MKGQINGLALCAGIGGLELGLSRAIGPSYRTVCYVERNSYAAATLVARFQDSSLDRAPVWDDLSTFDGRRWRGVVDIVSGGFPCQPFSTASRGRKVAVDLWPEFSRVIREAEPQFVFLENVNEAPWELVADDLRGLGYKSSSGRFCPSSHGAPHNRPRTFLLAHANRQGQPFRTIDGEVARLSKVASVDKDNSFSLGMDAWVPSRMDRLHCLGNAVVPQVAMAAFLALAGRIQ